jgi:outer membrane protein
MVGQAFSLPGRTKPSVPPLISNELFPTVRDLRGGLDGGSRRACVTLRMHPNKREKGVVCMYRYSGLLAAFAASCLLIAPAQSQTKVGVVNMQRALLDTAEMKKAQADLEAKFKPRQEEMGKIQKELEGIQQQLQTMQGKLTQQAEQDLNVQGQRKQRQLQRMGEDLQGEVERERNEILGRAGRRLQEIVAKLAEERGLDVVIEATNTIFFKNALELTKEATDAYDKAYPVK